MELTCFQVAQPLLQAGVDLFETSVHLPADVISLCHTEQEQQQSSLHGDAHTLEDNQH